MSYIRLRCSLRMGGGFILSEYFLFKKRKGHRELSTQKKMLPDSHTAASVSFLLYRQDIQCLLMFSRTDNLLEGSIHADTINIYLGLKILKIRVICQ